MDLDEIWYWEVCIDYCWLLVHIAGLKLISSLQEVSNGLSQFYPKRITVQRN
jgi:hypothetical protein